MIRKCIGLILMICAMQYNSINAQQQLEWAFLTDNNSSFTLFDKIALDAEANVFVLGRFKDTVSFGTNTNTVQLVSSFAGKFEIFIAKYNKDGEFLWVRRFEQLENTEQSGLGFNLVTDINGDVYASGYFTGTVKFSPSNTHTFSTPTTTLLTPMDNFVLKLDGNGNFKWAQHISKNVLPVMTYMVSTGSHCYALSTCKLTGDVLIGVNTARTASTFNMPNISDDTFYFGNLVITDMPGIHIGRIDSSTGDFKWVKTISQVGKSLTDVGDIDTDSLGNIYVAGAFRDTVNFNINGGSHLLVSDSFSSALTFRNMFLAKYDTAGSLIWTKKFDGNHYAKGDDIYIDKESNIHVIGRLVDTVDLNPDPNVNAIFVGNTILARYNSFISKYDSSGNYIWGGQLKGSRENIPRQISLDELGSIYVTGEFAGTVDFDPSIGVVSQSTPSNSVKHTFILKLDSIGNYNWVRTFGQSSGTRSCNGYSISLDHSHNVFVAGTIGGSSTVDFNSGLTPQYPLIATATQQGYLLKLACTDTSTTFFTEVACNEFTFNGTVYNQTGIYTQKFWSAGGCDSIVTLDLTIHTIDEPFITVNNFELGVTGGTFSNYQWLLNGSVISGATNATYTVNGNGDYQVVVTNEHGCSDTSEVYIVNNVSIHERNALAAQIKMFPNPSDDVVHINTPVNINIQLTTIDGRIVFNKENSNQFSMKTLAEGVYFLRIMDKENRLIKVEKVVKQ